VVSGGAKPGVRELQVVRALGPRGVAASVCAAQVDDPSRADHGYRPAVAALGESVAAVSAGACLRSPIPVEQDGSIACRLFELSASGPCACDATDGRASIALGDPAVRQLDPAGEAACGCELLQARGAAIRACQAGEQPVDGAGAALDGWCYVDATTSPADAPFLLACSEERPQTLRYVGAMSPTPHGRLVLGCFTDW
jgi:hypothetical protein